MIQNNGVTFNDFHFRTFANWKRIESEPTRLPDFRSDSGSMYWLEGDSVIRCSDHWLDRVASCSWILEGETHYGWTFGVCKLSDFVRGGNDCHFECVPANLRKFMTGKVVFEYANGSAIYDEKI